MKDFFEKLFEDRFELWSDFVNNVNVNTFLELGVYQGGFAEHILRNCPSIEKYYLLDPWRHLQNYNKPLNPGDSGAEENLEKTKRKTSFAKEKRVILRGKTTEKIDEIPDESLDFAYIDGDHRLKGITIDLNRVLPKVKDGGWIACDDFTENLWQHGQHHELTLIFPYAVYFAEAMDLKIYGLPHNQCLIHKSNEGFSFENMTNKYQSLEVCDYI